MNTPPIELAGYLCPACEGAALEAIDEGLDDLITTCNSCNSVFGRYLKRPTSDPSSLKSDFKDVAPTNKPDLAGRACPHCNRGAQEPVDGDKSFVICKACGKINNHWPDDPPQEPPLEAGDRCPCTKGILEERESRLAGGTFFLYCRTCKEGIIPKTTGTKPTDQTGDHTPPAPPRTSPRPRAGYRDTTGDVCHACKNGLLRAMSIIDSKEMFTHCDKCNTSDYRFVRLEAGDACSCGRGFLERREFRFNQGAYLRCTACGCMEHEATK